MKSKERGYTIMGEKKSKIRSTAIFTVFTAGYWGCLKRNQNASKLSEHLIKAFIRWKHRLPGQDLFRHSIVLR